MLRIAALLVVLGGTLAAGPLDAQSIYDNPPPRPPEDIPNSSFPPQPPPVRFPGEYPSSHYPAAQTYPAPAAPPARRPSAAIQVQPLPPPPGAKRAPPSSAPVESARVPPQSGSPPPQTAAPAPAPPADASAQPDDTVVTETPTEKIENARAVFAGLDKITGRITSFDVGIGETVQFGALRVTARACYTRPPTEATNTDAFVEIDEVTLKGEIKRIFTGWMFASSPGLHAVEHPIYDVWLTDCASPLPAQASEPAPQPTTAAAEAAPAPPPVRPRQAVRKRRRVAPAIAAPPQ